MSWLARHGFHAAQLSARQVGMRMRDLDVSSRRGIRTSLSVLGLVASGVDFLPPPEHFTDSGSAERVLDAALGAMLLCEVLDRVPLVVELPDEDPHSVVATIVQSAERRGIPLADLSLGTRPEVTRPESVSCAVDAAAVLAQGRDPLTALVHWGNRLRAVRITDFNQSGMRCAPGISSDGRLDLHAFLLALSLASPCPAPVLDARQWTNPREQLVRCLAHIEGAETKQSAARTSP